MRRNWVAGLSALLVIAGAGVALAQTKTVKQVGGGSSGDSLTAAPDTSAALKLGSDVTKWFVSVAADSQARWTVQISPDNVRWYTLIADSTGGARQAEKSAEQTFSGFWVRVILDPIPSGASPFGAAWLHVEK